MSSFYRTFPNSQQSDKITFSGEQIQIIRDQFKVDGIPYYIFVDRTGKATGRPDFRNHDLMKSELLKAVK